MLLSTAQKNSLEEATAAYAQQIDGAAEYLQARGVTREAAVTRRLGYVGEPLTGHAAYTGRLAIPYLTPTGVVDLRFRTIAAESDAPKYMSRPGVEGTMYGVLAFRIDSPYIAICEGEMDALVLQELCGIPAVGIPGASAWKDFYWRAFEDYDRVFVFADGDQAGKDFAKRVAQSIDMTVVIQMPEGQDVNSLYLSDGADGLRKRAGLE